MIKLFIILTMIVTGYCNDSCDKAPEDSAYAIMASGEQTYQGAIACPSWMPLGTRLIIEGERFICEDRGGASRGNRADIWLSTCEEATEWGRQKKSVIVLRFLR